MTCAALIYMAHIRDGERVLIHAGAGGVGLAAVQLARQRLCVKAISSCSRSDLTRNSFSLVRCSFQATSKPLYTQPLSHTRRSLPRHRPQSMTFCYSSLLLSTLSFCSSCCSLERVLRIILSQLRPAYRVQSSVAMRRKPLVAVTSRQRQPR